MKKVSRYLFLMATVFISLSGCTEENSTSASSSNVKAKLMITEKVHYVGEPLFLSAVESFGNIEYYRFESDREGILCDSEESVCREPISKSGEHTLTLKVISSTGEESQTSVTIYVAPKEESIEEKEEEEVVEIVPENKKPTAEFFIKRENDTFGTNITFDASDSKDDKGIVKYSWYSSINGKFGDGSVIDYSKLSAGFHTIKLKVTDSDNETSEYSLEFDIFENYEEEVVDNSNKKPFANIILEKNNFFDNELIRFDSHGSYDDGDIVKYEWRSNLEGLLGFGEVLKDITLLEGNHTIILTVTDNMGAISTATKNIMVEPEPSYIPPAMPMEPEEETKTTYKVDIEIKAFGSNWDIFGNAPDIEADIEIGEQTFYISKKQDSYTNRRIIENLEIENGELIVIDATDIDVSSNDYIGTGSFYFSEEKSEYIVDLSGNGKATFRFKVEE